MKVRWILIYMFISGFVLLTSPNIRADTDWSDIFATELKKVVAEKIDKKARIRTMKVVEKTSESIIIDVKYNKLYKYDGVEMEAYVLRGGSELNGFDSTVVDVDSKSGKIRLTLTWTDAQTGSDVLSDQIKLVLSREGTTIKSKSFDLRKKWMTLADAEAASKVADASSDDNEIEWDTSTTGNEDNQDTASIEPAPVATPAASSPAVIMTHVIPAIIKPFPIGKTSLKLYWSNERTDNYSTVYGGKSALGTKYRHVRTQAKVFSKKLSPQMVQLNTYYNPIYKDHFLGTVRMYKRLAKDVAGYRFVRREGYIYEKSNANNAIPLKLYHNPARRDYFIATSSAESAIARKGRYRYKGIIGYASGKIKKTLYRYIVKTKTAIRKSGKIKAGNIYWNCFNAKIGATCVTTGPWPVPGRAACTNLTDKIGAKIESYGHAGRKLTGTQLRNCYSLSSLSKLNSTVNTVPKSVIFPTFKPK